MRGTVWHPAASWHNAKTCVPLPEPTHTRTGNCWQDVVPAACPTCHEGTIAPPCELHGQGRGKCKECPRCEACEEEARDVD